MNNLSHEAHQMQKAAESGRKSQAQVDSEIAWLLKGPHIEGDLIIIPSPWFKAEAKRFWQNELGCQYSAHEKAWILHTGVALYPLRIGKKFTPEQWLRSITLKYRELWQVELEGEPEPEILMPPAIVSIAPVVDEYHPQHHTRGNWR